MEKNEKEDEFVCRTYGKSELAWMRLTKNCWKKKVKNSLKKCHENHIIIVINKIMASGLYPEKVV